VKRSTCSWARLTLAAATRRIGLGDSCGCYVDRTDSVADSLRLRQCSMPQAVARRVDLTSLMAAFKQRLRRVVHLLIGSESVRLNAEALGFEVHPQLTH